MNLSEMNEKCRNLTTDSQDVLYENSLHNKLYFDASNLYQKRKRLQNERHIYNVVLSNIAINQPILSS